MRVAKNFLEDFTGGENRGRRQASTAVADSKALSS